MVLWPLIAAALARKQTESAIKFVEGLFPDSQHPIDEEVMSEAKHGIDLWRNGERRAAEAQMRVAFQSAEQHQYV
jgi:hypothetical protein